MTKIKLTNKELSKLGIKATGSKYPTPFERLQKAIYIMEKKGQEDTIDFDFKNETCIIKIIDMKIISNNDLLRNDNRKIMRFKNLWHQRIINLVSGVKEEKWDVLKEKPMVLECLYKPSSGRFMDPDAITASFKSPLDGLVHSGLLKDDKAENVPLIIPKQEKNENKRDDLFMVLSTVDNIDKYYTSFFKNLIKTDR